VILITTQEHPGGQKVILQYAGKDATEAYEAIHPPHLLDEHLTQDKHLGELEEIQGIAKQRLKSKDELRVEMELRRRPPLGRVLNVNDMEASILTYWLNRHTLTFYPL
jgi:L-lactate dehydrogenase (cytochrome)